MGCNCGKPKRDGQCGCKSPAVLQINNPPEYITFHKVSVPAVMGDSTTNPPAVGKYKNVLLYYEADQTSWLYSTDGIPTRLTNGITNYEDAINLPKINGNTLIGDKTGEELGLQDKLTAGENIQISDENVISATDTTYTAGDGIEINSDNEISAKIGRGLEFNADGEINVSEDYIIGFDTVADMKASANLIDGSFAQTLGYHAKNDGGAGLYKIRNVTNDDVIDEGSIVEMNDPQNQLVAELIGADLNVNQFGAYGDGVHNDTQAFVNYITFASTINLLPKTYKLTNLNIAKDATINGNGATLIDDTAVDKFIAVDTTSTPKVLTVKFNDLNVDCPNSNYGIYIHTNIGEINNVLVKNAINTCVSVYKGSTSGRYGNLTVNGLRCQLSEVGLDIQATDVFIENFYGYNCMTHINVAGGLTHLKTVHGWNFNTQTKDWITGSTLIVANGDMNATDIYIDTLERGLVLPTGKPYQLINIQNLSFFINTSSYPKSQNSPEIFYNVSAYTGKLHCDGVAVNANAWTDIDNNRPVLIGNVPEDRIKLTNVSRDGFRQDVVYKPDPERGDIQPADFNLIVGTYVSMGTRKYVARDHLLNIVMMGTMKVGCPNNTVIYQCEFLSDLFKRCNRRANVNAVFYESSNEGYVYKLGASIDDNGKLSVFNNSGVVLGGYGHYGSIAVYIEMDNNYT